MQSDWFKAEETQQPTPIKPKEIQPPMPNPPKKEEWMKIGGVKITPQQAIILKEGAYIYLENMTNSKGQLFSGYIIINEEQQRAFMFKTRPDEFVKFGKYKMRAIDKRLIEAGCVVKAKVKWYGIGNFAYPYLWKENSSDTEYKESWGDPRKEAQTATNSIAKSELQSQHKLKPKKQRGKGL